MAREELEGGVSWWRGPLLGEGGYGSVYLAGLKDSKSRTSHYPPLMAVKSAESFDSCSLQKEKEVYSYLRDCPFILKCYGEEGTFSSEGRMFYNVLLEYASGGDLSSLIKKSSGGLPESTVRSYTRSILKGIDYFHKVGLVHCDLKPGNILLVSTESGDLVPKIGDFGLAKISQRELDGCVGGTHQYMAPETLKYNTQEAPSDIWALGCIVFEMLTGKKVYDSKSDTITDDVIQKISDKYELPKIHCETEISNEGKDFLGRCLVKNPMYRFTAEMLLNHPFLSESDETDGDIFVSSSHEDSWEEESDDNDTQGFCFAPMSSVIDNGDAYLQMWRMKSKRFKPSAAQFVYV